MNKYLKALAISILVSIYPAIREFGIDRDNYRLMFEGFLLQDELVAKFFYAKDISFFLVSEILKLSNNPDVGLLFFIFCLLSIFIKTISFQFFFPSKWFLFLIFYLVFFAPGLEFAAIRSGLASSFIIISQIFLTSNFILFNIASVSSHISYIIPGLFSIIRKQNFKKENKIFITLTFFFFFIFGGIIGSYYPQSEIYENNNASLYAYFNVIIIILIMIPVFLFKEKSKKETYYGIRFRNLTLFVFATACGIMPHYVTASFRYIELSLLTLSIYFFLHFKKTAINFITLIIMILYLCFFNIQRNTWLYIFYIPE